MSDGPIFKQAIALRPKTEKSGFGVWIGVAVALLVGAGVFVTSFGAFQSGALGAVIDVEGPEMDKVHARVFARSAAAAVLEQASKARKKSDKDGVRYKVRSGGTLADVARVFGMPLDDLKALNPDVSADKFLPANSEVVLYKQGVLEDKEPREEDRLYEGRPLLEGPGRKIRRRVNSWGTKTTVEAMDKALRHYGETYPDGPVVIVSDISRRHGGRLAPHHSHRSGRDVDTSYVPVPRHDNGGFLMMKEGLFDVERNWTFISALLATGDVDVALIDYSLQALLYEHAKSKGMSEAELSRIFQYPRDRKAEAGIIRHWDGHRDHMHIRFRGEGSNDNTP